MSVANIPIQSLPEKKKNKEWRESTVESYINKSSFDFGSSSRRQHLLKLYDYYNGKIDNEDYNYVLAPYGKERKNFPAKIRNYPLIKPSIDLLLGEKAKRPFNFTVIVSSQDVETVRTMAMQKEINDNLQKWVIFKLNAAGFNTGIEQEEKPPLPQEIERIFERNWRDNRAIMAQKALEYLIPYLNYRDESQKGWFDFLVSGYVFTEKGVRNNEPFYRTLNPVDVDYDKDPNIDFVEDGNWVVIRELVSRSSIIDHFRKTLSKEQIDRLESPQNSNNDMLFWYGQEEQAFSDDVEDYVELCTVYWKSVKKVGFRTYIDEYGEVYEEVVDEDYKQQPDDIDLEWDWINEVWQGYRVDGDLYFDIKPIEAQRSSIDNPSKCKLPVNGRIYSERNSTNISMVQLGISYQLSYNIFKYRLENAIAKSKDILAMLDISLIPKDWTMDKFMTILESTGIAWVNYQQEGMQFNPQHQSVLDMSIRTIDQYINLLRFIREEWEYVSGVSRQRMGEIGQYQGKASGEQAIIQSSHITEEFYRKFYGLEQRDLQGLIDLSQIAWINGKKANYITNKGYSQFLNIDPETFAHEEFGIFVKDANLEREKLEQIRGLGQSFIQNGAPMSIVAEMLDSDNFAELKDLVQQAEQSMQELQDQAQKAEQAMAEAELQSKQEERAFTAEQNERDRQNKIDIELIKLEFQDVDENTSAEEIQRRKLELENRYKQAELAETKRSNKAKESIERAKIRSTNSSSN